MWTFLKGRVSKPKGLSCLSFNTDGIAFSHVMSVSDRQLDLSHCDFLPSKNHYQQSLVLRQYVKDHALSGADCVCILNPNDYRLLLLDIPNVPEEELKQATRFLIKDLIDVPIKDVAVDFFKIPTLTQKEKMYVVAARMKLLEKVNQLVRHSELNLCYIDITELALRNLLVLGQNMVKGIAFLFIHLGSLYVVIVHDTDVCFARQISTGVHLKLDRSSIGFENLITKLQQTFDYYQTQMAKEPPSKLLLAPMVEVSEEWLFQLNSNLSMEVEKLDLNTWLTLKEPLSVELQARCLVPIAEALQMNEIIQGLGRASS